MDQKLNFSQSALDNAIDPICCFDKHGNIIYANAAMTQAFGYKQKAILKRSIIDLDTNLNKDNWTATWKKMAKRKLARFESTFLTKDKKLIAVDISLSHIDAGDDNCICAFIRDITELKTLKPQTTLLKNAIDNAGESIYLNDIEGNILYANKYASEETGFTIEQLHTMKVFDIDPAVDQDSIRQFFEHARNAPPTRIELVHKDKDGKEYPVESIYNIEKHNGTEYAFSLIRDISALKQQQRWLEQLQFTLKHAADPVFLIDEEGNFLFVNDAACDVLGYSHDELIAKRIFDIAEGMKPSHWKEHLANTKEHNFSQAESIHIRKDGSTLPVEVSVNYGIFDGKGYICAFARDISERKQLLEDLQENEERFRTLFHNSAMGMMLLDMDRAIIMANPAFCNIINYAADEVIGQTAAKFTHPDDANIHDELAEKLLRDEIESYTLEKRYLSKDKREIWASVTISLARTEDGHPLYFVAQINDITEKKQILDDLKTSEQRFRSLFDNSAVAMLVLRPTDGGKLLYANQAYADFLGYSLEDFNKQNVYTYSHPDNAEKQAEMNEKLLSGEIDFYNMEKRYFRKDGSTAWGHLTVSAVRDEKATVLYYISQVQDITEQKKNQRLMEMLQFAIENAKDEIFIYKEDGSIEYINKSACNNMGYSFHELTLKRLYEIDPTLSADDWPERWKTDWEHQQQQVQRTIETIHERIDGSNYPIEIAVNYAQLGDGKYGFAFCRDITERNKTQEQLVQFKDTLDNVLDCVFMFEPDNYRFIYVNQGAVNQIGCSRDKLLQMTPIDIKPHYDVNDFRKLVAPLVSGEKQSLYFETIHRSVTGIDIPVEISLQYVKTYGSPRFVAIVRDLTERKQAAKKLQQLQFAIDNAFDTVYIGDGAGNILYANESASRTLGYTPEELLSMNVIQIDPKLTDETRAAHREIIDNRDAQLVESEHFRKDGTSFPVEVTFNSKQFDDQMISCAFVRNITERKKELRKLEELSFAVDNAADAVYLHDTEGKFYYVNKQAIDMLGFDLEQFLNMSVFDIAPNLTMDSWLETIAHAKESKYSNFETVHKRKDGTLIPVEVSFDVGAFEGGDYVCSFVRDIRERKEQQRKNDELMFAIENATDAVYLIDTDTNFYYVNKAACQDLGYDYDELINMNIYDIDEEFTPDIWSTLSGLPKQGIKSRKFERVHRRKNGSYFPVEISLNIENIYGVDYFCAFARDVTERKAANKQNEQLSFIIQNTTDAVYIFDKNRNVLYANKAASEQTGYSHEELLNLNVRELDPSFDKERRNALWNQAREQQTIIFETLHQRKDRSLYPVEIAHTVTVFDGIEFACVFVRDITERKAASKQMEELRFTVENAIDAIYLYDVKGDIYYVNDSGCEILGYERDELLTMNIGDIDENFSVLISEERWKQALSKQIKPFEAKHKRKDGSKVPVEITVMTADFDGTYYVASFVRDITERKQYEKTLLTLEYAVNNTEDVFFLMDKDGTITYANDTAVKQLGYPKDEIIGEKIYKFDTALATGEADWNKHWETINDDEMHTFEVVHERKDGSRFPVEVRTRVTDFMGETFGVSLERDITERKEASRKLEELRYAIDNVSDPIYLYNNYGDIYYVNQAACEELGYRYEELTSMKVFDIDTAMTEETWRNIYPRIKWDKEVGIFESENRRRDGSVFPVEVTASNFELDGFEFGCSLNRNLTERKANERQLLFTKFAMDNAGDSIFFTDPRGRFMYVNETACQFLGYSKEEILKMDLWDLDPAIEPGKWDADEQWQNLVDNKIMTFETKHRRKDGENIPVEIKVCILEFQGEQFGCSVVRDIRERKEAQNQIEQYQHHLEKLVEERTNELREAQDELVRKERLAVLGQLTGVVGHELRNPLGTIRTALFLIRQKAENPSSSQLRAFDRAERNIVRCDKIIDELLDYTRSRPLELENISVAEWLNNLLDEYSFPENIALDTDIERNIVVNIEPDRFRRCIINSLSNACEAMQENPPERPKTLHIHVHKQASEIAIEIEDTGPGIPEDRLTKIFEPLFSTKGFGVGLGLPIVEQIVKQHGGSVAINSTVGQGTKLTLTLPDRIH